MPEITAYSRKEIAYTLDKAVDDSPIVRARCHLCNTTRHYLTREIFDLVGRVPVVHLARHFTCETCRTSEYMSAEVTTPWGHDYGTLPVRRVAKVYFVRKVKWQDGVL